LVEAASQGPEKESTFVAVGPYVGHRDDQFIVQFSMDLTPNGGERMQLVEVGLYTVASDKIVQEEYLYLM
jgi:hypothetical protein